MILLTHAPGDFALYYGEEALAGLAALTDVRRNETGAPLAGEAFRAAATGCTIVVGDSEAIADAYLFDTGGFVAYVHCHVDVRRINVEAASRNGILVTRTSAGFGAAVAELILGLMIDLARDITASAVAWRAGNPPKTYLGRQLSGSTLGIIGYGHIGRHLARIAAAIGMRILAYDPYVVIEPGAGVEPVTLESLLGQSDFVVPLAVATSETTNLIDGPAIARMKPTAFLVNASRGDLVDEAALAKALEARGIAGAALDVGRAPRQKPPDHLARRSDVIATPHIGGVTPPALRHQAMETLRQVEILLSGQIPPGGINPESATRLQRLRR